MWDLKYQTYQSIHVLPQQSHAAHVDTQRCLQINVIYLS